MSGAQTLALDIVLVTPTARKGVSRLIFFGLVFLICYVFLLWL